MRSDSGSVYTKLNLGCGRDRASRFPSPWLNVDCAGDAADVIADIRRLRPEWSDTFDEVRASHVLEHFFLKEMDSVLAEWVRVLAPGGVLRLIVPDLSIVLRFLLDGQDSKDRPALSVTDTTPTLAQIYGVGYDDPKAAEAMRHRFIFNEELLRNLLGRQPLLTNIQRYRQSEDPAGNYGIDDDSQNRFSLCVLARKRILGDGD